MKIIFEIVNGSIETLNIEDDKLLIMNLYSKYKAIYQYFDDWIVIKTDENYEDITEIIAKKKEKHHIETNVW